MAIPTSAEADRAHAAQATANQQRWKTSPQPSSAPRPAPQKPAATNRPAASKIEFRCAHCQKLVRVASSAAGQMGQCPQCKAVIKIPSHSTAKSGLTPLPNTGFSPAPQAASPAAGLTPLDSGLTPLDNGLTPIDDGLTPLDSGLTPLGATAELGLTPLPADSGLTPLGGTAATASDDPFADLGLGSLNGGFPSSGLNPSANPYVSPALNPAAKRKSAPPLSFTGIVGTTWTVFTENLGTCVLAALMFWGSSIALAAGWRGVNWLLLQIVIAVGRPPSPEVGLALFVVYVVVVVCIFVTFMTWLHACMSYLAVEIAKGRKPDAGDAFKGGAYMGQILLMNFLLGLAMMPMGFIAGGILAIFRSFVAVIIVYIAMLFVNGFLWLIFSLAPYFIVGDNKNAVEALSLSAQHSMKILPTYFAVMIVVSLGVGLFSTVTCMTGLIACFMFLPVAQAVVYVAVRRS
jgi:phage FluMu protein Com